MPGLDGWNPVDLCTKRLFSHDDQSLALAAQDVAYRGIGLRIGYLLPGIGEMLLTGCPLISTQELSQNRKSKLQFIIERKHSHAHAAHHVREDLL
jgi:hypothetical protein